MSHRKIKADPLVKRTEAYKDLEISGESQRGVWKTIEYLAEQGIDVGPDAVNILAKRKGIKNNTPK
jgi:hypothetical protein